MLRPDRQGGITISRKLLTIALAGLIVLGIATSAGAADSARTAIATASAKACNVVTDSTSFPPASYVTSLTVRHVSCSKGKSITRAYHRCRKAHGGAGGHCPIRVQKFKCREGKRLAVPGVQYNATVNCKRGKKRVVSTYTQNI